MRLDDVALFVIFLESNIVVMLVFAMLSPGGQIAVYFFPNSIQLAVGISPRVPVGMVSKILSSFGMIFLQV